VRSAWPGLVQARGIACMVIIICGRRLNLAVPILYKKVRGVLQCCSIAVSAMASHTLHLPHVAA
jgi:hypothetical protein